MTPAQGQLLDEAGRSLEAAKVLRQNGYFGYSASRAYYAMFYAAEALLLGKGLTFSKHAGVVAAFGRDFVKSGDVPPQFHRYLIEGMELRQVGDYGRSGEVSADQCRQQLSQAQEFIELAKRLLGTK